MRGIGRTLEERLRIEAEMTISMFMRRDSHTIGAGAFKKGLTGRPDRVAEPRAVTRSQRAMRACGPAREPLGRQDRRRSARRSREGS